MSEKELVPDQASKPSSCDCRTNIRSIAYYSGQFAIDIFWGMIMSLVTPLMTDRLGASAELTSLIWMTAPFAGLIAGTYVGSLVDSLGNTDSEKRTYRLGVMWISLLFIIVLCVVFAPIPIFLPPKTEEGSRLACAVATILFFLLMIAINFYVTPYFCMKGHFGDAPVSKFVPPIWSALGYITAMMIIKYPLGFASGNYQISIFLDAPSPSWLYLRALCILR
jgi:Na+/melibiose symporter-like transporter